VARALGTEDAADGLYDLAAAVGAKTALKDIGMREADIDRVADLVTQNPYHNPRPITREAVRALLVDAYEGRKPVRH
jgi:alcohol dehydrogenase class IV